MSALPDHFKKRSGSTSVSRKIRIVLVTAIVGLGGLHLAERLSATSLVPSFLSTAEARVVAP
jgi:hypothetical protein